MGEAQGQGALVREQQGAPAFLVKPADGVEPLALGELIGQQVQHRRTPLGVAAAAQHPGRFVEQDQQRCAGGRDRLAVQADLVPQGIGPLAQLGHLAIDPDPAVPQPGLHLAPGAQARRRQHLL